MSSQVTGGLTTLSLWYDSQLQQATMNDPIIRINRAKAVCNACTLQGMLVPSPTMYGQSHTATLLCPMGLHSTAVYYEV